MVASSPSGGVNFTNFLFPNQAADMLAIQRQKAISQQLLDQPVDDPAKLANPGGFVIPYSPWQGLEKVASKMSGAYLGAQADEATRKLYQDQAKQFASLLGGGTGTSTDQALQMGGATGDAGPTNTNAALAARLQGQNVSSAPPQTSALPNGMSMRDIALASMMPEPVANVMLDRFKTTDQMKNDQYRGLSPNQSRGIYLGTQAKDMGLSGVMPQFDANGGMSVAPIPGAVNANATMKGAETRATQGNTIFPNQTVNGMTGVPVPGNVIFDSYGNNQPPAPAAAPALPPAPPPPSPLPQQPPVTGGGASSPVGGPVPLYQPTSEADRNQTIADVFEPDKAPNTPAPANQSVSPQVAVANMQKETPPAESTLPAPVPPAAASAQPPIKFGVNPVVQAAAEEAGKKSAVIPQEIDEDAKAALGTKRTLSELRLLGKDFTPNKLAAVRKAVAEYKIASGMGDANDAKFAAATEGVDKLTAQLATQAMKEFTNRGTQMEFKTFLANNPNIMMSPGGFQTVLDFMLKSSDLALNKQQEFQSWKKDKDPSQFQDFNAYWSDKQNKNMAASLSPAQTGMTTITNPTTKQRMILKDNKWHPM